MFLVVFLAAVLAAISGLARGENEDLKVMVSGDDMVTSGLKAFLRLYDDCQHRDGLSACLKMRAITFFDRASRMEKIPLSDSLVILKNPPEDPGNINSNKVNDFGRTLPVVSVETSEEELDTQLLQRVVKFFNTHNVQVSFPRVNEQELEKGIEEGRGKMKKMMGSMMMMMGMKLMMLIPIAIGGLFMLAGKALIISKIALVLTMIIALKKILGGQSKDSGHESHGWQSGGGGGGGWDRSLKAMEASQKMAYRGQLKKINVQQH